MPSYKVGMTLTEAKQLAEKFQAELAKVGITHTEVAGSIRRQEKTIGDIDMLVEGQLAPIRTIPGVDYKDGLEEKMTFVYDGQQFNVFRTEPSYWGAMLCYLTGPKGATIHYRIEAVRKGMKLNQKGLFDSKGVKIAGETEESIFNALDHPMKPPERRGKK